MLRHLFVMLLACLTTATEAGEWVAFPAAEGPVSWGECQYAFTGAIEPGDLTGIIDQPVWKKLWNKTVCLDSPGGSLGEVYDFITRTGSSLPFATHIESDARCESACAILFMFGQTWGANSASASRSIEPGGRLGFHSPYLSGAPVSDAEREDAFRVALDVAQLLNNTAYMGRNLDGATFPMELVAIILNTPGDEMHYVDTIGEQALLGINRRWSAEIDNRQVRVSADRAGFVPLTERICLSSFAMNNPEWIVKDGYDFDDLVAFVADNTGRTQVLNLVEIPATADTKTKVVGVLSGPFGEPGWNSAGAALYCRVEFTVEPGDGFYTIKNHDYHIEFGSLLGLKDNELPERRAEVSSWRVGLIPIDTKF